MAESLKDDPMCMNKISSDRARCDFATLYLTPFRELVGYTLLESYRALYRLILIE